MSFNIIKTSAKLKSAIISLYFFLEIPMKLDTKNSKQQFFFKKGTRICLKCHGIPKIYRR